MSNIYLEKDGMKFAVVQSYRTKEEGYGYAVVLDKMYLTDEFLKHQSETGDQSFPINFRMVVEKPKGRIIYDRCMFASFEHDFTNVEIRALMRDQETSETAERKPPTSKYADSTLRKMSKTELIEYIRMLEHNYAVAVEFNENQARNIEKFLKDLRKEK